MDLGRPDRANRLEALAAEYALGTLSPRARRRLDAVARRNPDVAAVVRAWEYRLAGLAEAVPSVTPAPRVWSGIQQRLGLSTPGVSRQGTWWTSLSLWRGLATAALAVALGLGVLMTMEREAQPVVVVLAGQDARPALIASATRGSRTLVVKTVNPIDVAPGRALELWALPEGQNPRPLGLLPASGVARVSLPEPAGAMLGNAPVLAVSLEPAGGSPTGLPTGPVLYTGTVQRMY